MQNLKISHHVRSAGRRRFSDAEVWCGTSAVIHRPGGSFTLRSDTHCSLLRITAEGVTGSGSGSGQCGTANQDHP